MCDLIGPLHTNVSIAGEEPVLPPLPALDYRSYLTLFLFIICMIPIVRPFTIPITIPRLRYVIDIPLDYGTAPLITLCLLMAVKAISPPCVRDTIIGAGSDDDAASSIEPMNILLLFFSLAYICLSMDVSGLLPFFALRLSHKSATSPANLFMTFFGLSSLLTIVTSNDVVILTLSPIVVHFSYRLRIDPTAFLVSVFQSANIWSSLLQIGNLSNLIVSSALDLSFINYSLWMTLPTICGSLTAGLLLWLRFRNKLSDMNEQIEAHRRQLQEGSGQVSSESSDTSNVTSSSPLDPFAGIFGLVCFLCCIITLLVTSFYSVPIYLAALPFGLLMLARDFIADLYSHCRKKEAKIREQGRELTALSVDSRPNDNRRSTKNTRLNDNASKESVIKSPPVMGNEDPTVIIHLDSNEGKIDEDHIDDEIVQPLQMRVELAGPKAQRPNQHKFNVQSEKNNNGLSVGDREEKSRSLAPPSNNLSWDNDSSSQTDSSSSLSQSNIISQFMSSIVSLSTNTTTGRVFSLLPFRFIPFLLSMFPLVQALHITGWLPRCAKILTDIGVAQSIWGSIFAVTFLSGISCILISNFPMTLLFTRILLSPHFAATATVRKVSLLAVVLQSNTAPNLALSGALGGLVWLQLLREKRVMMSWVHYFIYYGAPIATICSIPAALMLVLMAYQLG